MCSKGIAKAPNGAVLVFSSLTMNKFSTLKSSTFVGNTGQNG